MDQRRFKEACGAFATGVMVATCMSDTGRPVGVTVNSFSSVSLDPPLVLFCLAHDAAVHAAFLRASCFALNTLHDGQRAVSDRFAALSEALFDGLDYRVGALGAPVFPDAAAILECRLAERRPVGDHDVFVGRVENASAAGVVRPLIYHRGGYAGLG